MGRSNYVRLYLAAKFCKPEDDGTYKAAIVLWARKDDVEGEYGRDDCDDLYVKHAVDFGTCELSHVEREQFRDAKGSNGRDKLPKVAENVWSVIGRNVDRSHPAWTLSLPRRGLLYKVSAKKSKKSTGNV